MKSGVAYADGGNRSAPGPYACAVVLQVEGEPQAREEAKYLGSDGTNNLAEANALILALHMAIVAGVTHLRIRCDSKLIVEQALGNWKIKNDALRVLHAEARRLAMGIESVSIDHVRREKNTRADALCTRLLDEKTGRARGY